MSAGSATGLLLVLGGIFALSTGDRTVLPVLKTTLADKIHLTNSGYSWIVSAFMTSYTLAYLGVGQVVHRLGARRTLTGSVLLMSVAVGLSGLVQSAGQLAAALVLLGLAQACVVPVVTLTIFQNFAPHRHARAYAIVNVIQSAASVACPSLVAFVTLWLDWRWAFLLPGATGLLVAALWRKFPVQSGSDEHGHENNRRAAGWVALLRSRPVLILILARAISDPFWFFFQYWNVAFLRERIGMTLAEIGYWAWIPPLTATAAAFAFATFSDRLMYQHGHAIKARLWPMLWATTFAVGVLCLPLARSAAPAIALCALAAAMCNTWLSLSAILMGALVPRASLASALGLMSAVGGVCAIVLNGAAGVLIDHFGYGPTLLATAVLYPIAAILLAAYFFGYRGTAPQPLEPSLELSSP